MVRATAATGKDKHGRPIFLTGAKTDFPQNELKGTEGSIGLFLFL